MHKFNKMVVCAAVAAFSLMFAAQAKTCVWSGKGKVGSEGLYWSDTNNWEGCVCPVSGDSVCITNTTKYNSVNDISGLTLPYFYYYCESASTLNAWQFIKLTGTDNAFVVGGKTTHYLYSRFNLEEGAKVTIKCVGTASISFAVNDMFRGKGTVDYDGGSSGASIYFGNYHEQFEGTFNILATTKGTCYLRSEGSSKCGAPKARINAYRGFNANDGNRVMYGEYHFYNGNGVTSQRMTTFEGDVYCHASSANQIFQFNPYGRSYSEGKLIDAGFIFNGKVYTVNDGVQARLIHYTYGTKDPYGHNDSIITYNGEVDFGVKGIDISFQHSATGAIVTVGAKLTSTAQAFAQLNNDGYRLYTTAPNVLPKTGLYMGNTKSRDYVGIKFDLKGNDQTIGSLLTYWTDGYTQDYELTSTDGPATLSFAKNGSCVKLPAINGQLSLNIRKAGDRKAFTFPFNGDTSGYLLSGWDAFNFTGVTLPNLGGLVMTNQAGAIFATTSVINEDMEMDILDCASGQYRGVYVATGKDQKVKRVIYNNVDLPAGTYCRSGAGVSGATVAAWMGYGATAADWNGTITIAEHDPIAIWTGAAGDGLMTTAGNWGDNQVPDFTNAKLTLDLRRAGTTTVMRPRQIAATISNGPHVFGANPTIKRVNGVVITFR